MACMANIHVASQKAVFLGSQYLQMLGLQGGFAPLNPKKGALPLDPAGGLLSPQTPGAIGYPLSFKNYLL